MVLEVGRTALLEVGIELLEVGKVVFFDSVDGELMLMVEEQEVVEEDRICIYNYTKQKQKTTTTNKQTNKNYPSQTF